MIKNFLNPEGHQNCISGSKVTAILQKGLILPIGGASAVEGLQSTGLPCLVYIKHREIAKSCPEKSHQLLSQFEFCHNFCFEFCHKLKKKKISFVTI